MFLERFDFGPEDKGGIFNNSLHRRVNFGFDGVILRLEVNQWNFQSGSF
jgi:hypothetical protein